MELLRNHTRNNCRGGTLWPPLSGLPDGFCAGVATEGRPYSGRVGVSCFFLYLLAYPRTLGRAK